MGEQREGFAIKKRRGNVDFLGCVWLLPISSIFCMN